jgi:hypothetical protein
VTQQLETRIVEEVKNILASAGEEVIQAEHFILFIHEPLTQMRPDEPRPACH